ncbi:MAG: VOC family protein [Streptosporangiales bacterium]|nr:VOC family protein [Streptosporangiales bacterium]
MFTEIDHLVWASNDLAGLVAHVTSLTGVEPQAGGQHEGRGTRNHLLALGAGRYLELIGPDPEQAAPATSRPFQVDRLAGHQLAGWAARTSTMGDVLTASRERGYDPGPVEDMSRQLPDGSRLSWQLTPPSGGLAGVLPFVIDWRGGGHPADELAVEVELLALQLTHPDPAAVERGLDALLLRDRDAVTVEAGQAPALRAQVATPNGVVELR